MLATERGGQTNNKEINCTIMKKNVMCAYFTEEHEQIMDGPVPWNSIEDILLIQFIENHPCLYDISCKEYQLSELKSDLWHEIGDRLNKDGTIIMYFPYDS